MPNSFDYIVIGAGPAGAEAAGLIARQTKTVALIERDKWGDTCLHEGCIPTKTLLHLTKQPFVWDLPELFAKVFAKVQALSDNMVANLKRADVTLIEGEATVVNAHEVSVNGERLTAAQIIFAGGSRPLNLKIAGIEGPLIYDSHSIYSLTKKPSRLAIVGGGYIGFEWAQIFMRLGAAVTIYEALPQVLGALDEDVRRRLLGTLRGSPLLVKTNETIRRFSHGKDEVTVESDSGIAAFDAVMLAVGRKPLDIALPPEVIRIGDAKGYPLLAHKASSDAKRLFAENAIDPIIPSVIYTDPEIASVGQSEKELKKLQVLYKSYKMPYRANSKAFVTDEDEGFVKLLTIDNDKYLVGAAIIGTEAGNIINVLTLAIQEKIPIAKLKRLVFPHPTIGEVLGQALDLIP